MICFTPKEIVGLFRITKQQEINTFCTEMVITKTDLADKQIMNGVVDKMVEKSKQNKEDVEFFIAIDACLTWYNDVDKKVCFDLKRNIQANTLEIADLNDLKKVVEENTLTDFAIWSHGLRKFQLKQYKDELKTEPFFNKIRETLKKYGNDLGQTNLFFILQSDDAVPKMDIDFRGLNQKLKELDIKNIGHIIVQYNQEGKFIVINQVYPEIKSTKKNLSLPSINWF